MSICYPNIYFIVKYVQNRIVITKIRDRYAVFTKYYLYFCSKITIIDKILQYDTRFLG